MLLQLGEQRLDRIDDLDGVGAWLPRDGQVQRACRLRAGVPRVLDAVVDVCDLVEAHRAAVSGGDRHRGEIPCLDELPVGLHDERAIGAAERARWTVHVGAGDGMRDLVDADLTRVQLLGSTSTRTANFWAPSSSALSDAASTAAIQVTWSARNSNARDRRPRSEWRTRYAFQISNGTIAE